MTQAPTVKSIRCTTCAAPLKLYGGGHKILTLTCEYCGSVMDVRREFELLHQFKNHAKKPACPIELGMQGQFYGVTFTAIGPMIAIGSDPQAGLPGVFGATIAAGIFGVLVAPLVGKMLRFFPPVVTGTEILAVGLSLMGVAAAW